MKPRTIGWVLAGGLVLIGLIWWLSRNAVQEGVRLEDGSTVRVVRITRGTKHGYTPPVWRAWLEKLHLVEPYLGILDWRFSTPEPRMYVWIQRRFPNPQNTRRILRARLVDHKGAFIPARAENPHLWNSREEIFGVELPYLPANSGPVWLEFGSFPKSFRNSHSRLLINPPFVSRPAQPLKPHPLPARVKTPEMEVELERLGIVRNFSSDPFLSGSLMLTARLSSYHNGKRKYDLIVAEEWFEDPYGNRYEAGEAPPWHYPYWIYCATFYRSENAKLSIPPRGWRSDWLQIDSGTDIPLNAQTTQHGFNIRVLGVFQREDQVFEVDASNPNQYRVRPVGAAPSTKQNHYSPDSLVEIQSGGQADVWRVDAKIPLVLVRIQSAVDGSYSLSYTSDGSSLFVVNDYDIFVFFQDEQGRIYPLPVVEYETDQRTKSGLFAAWFRWVPRTVRRGRIGVAVFPPVKVRIPIPPLSEEMVRKVWDREPVE